MKDMLHHAYDNGYAVGAFDLVSLDFLEGIISATERCRAPVILSLAESHFNYFDFELIMPAVEAAAQRATVPVAIHLDHGASLDSAVRAINPGCNGNMVDTSHAPMSENIRCTRAVVNMTHACGVPVEGELGYVPGVEAEDAERHPGEITYMTVAEARSHMEQTGVDFLAVSIGTMHGRMTDKPKLDFQRLKQINENIRTGKSRGFTGLVKNIRTAVATEVERCIRLWGGAGRANEVLSRCRPWMSVEHLIIYNVEGIDKTGAETMIAEGRQVLSTIPGVREVFTGEAVQDAAKYRDTWLVRFCHPAVIDSYREHPGHVTFADKRSRPPASERISIDYQMIDPVVRGSGYVEHSINMKVMS